jgi:hypothetical protein
MSGQVKQRYVDIDEIEICKPVQPIDSIGDEMLD